MSMNNNCNQLRKCQYNRLYIQFFNLLKYIAENNCTEKIQLLEGKCNPFKWLKKIERKKQNKKNQWQEYKKYTLMQNRINNKN